ncbi:hypothetical protein CYMTET_16901 [Cymbomonas tetramitiformis]|uniref:Uncharacterized protein n=1 Tax=Cymbomonas tetramitiformis TaxID=36881 RepID=A0AAE0GBF9_9CHLO|nr:hypothetical protein CYMTET_16901 [Cymbomonas tetramitiformis]
MNEIILAHLFSTGKIATESSTDRQKQQRAERRAQRAIRVSQHFTELEGEEGAASGQPEAQAPVQPQVQAQTPVQPQVQAQEPLVIFEEDMEYTDSARINLGTLPIYTGTKEEDRPKFLREFADMCENFVRQHNANVRRRLRSGAGTLIDAQMKTLRETPPDFEYLWDIIPACLAGENSQTLSWWRENYEKGGVVASNMDRVLKDTSEHGPLEGTIPCARPPFNEMNTGTTWVIARPVTNQDAQGEVYSNDYLTDGTSLKGLTGHDGTRDTQYFYALRGFIAALDKKFMMKGTQEKVDLLSQKPQEVGQDGLTYMKMCQRREMQLNTGKVLSDEELRTFIEDYVENLRIKVFQTRVKEQLRAQFPPPNRVTWKDLESIIEVQDKLKGDAESWILTFLQEITRRCGCQYSTWEARQHGLDLKAIKNSIKKIESAGEGQPGELESSKKAETPPSKKMKKEVNVAERAKKTSYNKTPPPAEGVRTNDKPKCLRCFGGGWHESDPEQCRSGYKHVKMPAGFHESRLGSSKWWDAENAALRMYNLKNRFKNSDWGILVTDWQQLSNDEKDKYRAKQAPEDKQKGATGNPEALKAEYQGMVAARKTASRAGSVKSQVLSEDEGSDEEPVAARVAERETHIADAHAHHHGSAGAGAPSGPPTELLSAMAEEMGEEALSSALNTLGLGALPETLCKSAESELTAAPAVALGSTQRMRGFPVKTPEEYEADAQVPMAPAADEMQRKVQLMASVIKSLGAAFRKLAAGLVAEGRITAPRGVETLVELAESNQLPTPTASAADCQDISDEGDDCPGMESDNDSYEDDDRPGMESGDDSDEEEIPLDEMPEDTVEQPRKGRTAVRVTAAAATVQESYGVRDFSERGELHAGTMEAKAYELLKKRMLSGLTEEQLTAMAQVQPVCKLLNDSLAQGMALMASGGLLMLYKALLLDTGANCNIIPIRTVNRLGLTIFDAETGARVARCDGSPAEFTKYCYVDVVLAAGTPYMTRHRLHAFVTYTNDTTWDFLVGTGPLKNALKLTIDLYRGIATSEAAVSLGMREKVTLPLIELTPPVDARSKRNEDPRVCLATEIFDDDATLARTLAPAFEGCAPPPREAVSLDTRGEDRLALAGERCTPAPCAFSRNHPELVDLLASWLEEMRLRRFNSEERERLDARCQSMVEAGFLKPSSMMRVELTGRVSLHAESTTYEPPVPGTSITDQMLGMLQASSRSQREANVATRSEWSSVEEPAGRGSVMPASLATTQTDPRYPDLTPEQEAESEADFKLASVQPWVGMAVNPWDYQDKESSWSQQRLYIDRTGYARLCTLCEEGNGSGVDAGFVQVQFSRCGEFKTILETELLWPDFTLVDQKVDKETKIPSEAWTTRASGRKDNDQVPLPDCGAHWEAGRYTMASVQETLNTHQIYPGVVTGKLMWDKVARQFCVLSEHTRAQWDLMERMVRHTMEGAANMSPMGKVTGEFQLPFYYEKDQRWQYQHLKYVQRVDIADLRARLKVRYDKEVAGVEDLGVNMVPQLTLSDAADKVGKFYPVTDGEGGNGEVFSTNAAAVEYLHLGDNARVMLGACKTEEQAHDALDTYGARRNPPVRTPKTLRTLKMVRGDEAGPSGSTPPPSSATLRLRHQTWPNGAFDPARPEYHTSVFQGTYEPESPTRSENTAGGADWLDLEGISEFTALHGQTVFLIQYRCFKGEIEFQLGKPYAQRGKGVHTQQLSSKTLHRYSSSAGVGQRGEFLPLGGQSKGCTGGLLGTLQKHMEHLVDRTQLLEIARSHLSNGPQQGTLRVFKTRANAQSKAVNYLFEDHRYYRERGPGEMAFTLEYLSSGTRKFDCCSWETWNKVAVMHREPLSAFTSLVGPALLAEAHRAEVQEHLRNDFMRCLDPIEGEDDSHAGSEEEDGSISGHSPDLAAAAGVSTHTCRTRTPSPQTEDDDDVEVISERFVGLSASLARGRAEVAANNITMAALSESIRACQEIIRSSEEIIREYEERPRAARATARMSTLGSDCPGLDGRGGARAAPTQALCSGRALGGTQAGGLECNMAQRPEHQSVHDILRSPAHSVCTQRTEAMPPVAQEQDAFSPARPSLRSSPGAQPGTQPADEGRAKRTQVCFLLMGVFVHLQWPQLPHFAVVVVWMAMEVSRFLGEVVADWAWCTGVPRRAMARALWAIHAAPLEPWAHQRTPLRVLLELARHLLLLIVGALKITGLHHAQRGLWYVPLLRFGLAMLAMHFTHMVGTLGCVLTVGAHVMNHGLPGSCLIYNGGAFATLEARMGRALAVAQRILAAGPATLAAVPRRMQKPRFAARLQRLRFTAACYQVAHCIYVASVLALVVYVSAGGGLGRMQGGWRMLTCILTLHPPVKPVGTSRILKLLLLLAVAAWVAAVAPGEFQGMLTMGSCSGSPTGSIRTAWEDQRSSRQWDTGWEAMVAERDEVLPHTVLDTLQPGGTTRVTKDEAAWLDTELNATFGGHPEFTEENWEEMRNVVRRCSYCFANKPQDIKGYHGGAAHATFAIPFKDETKVAYQRPRKYSPGEQEIIDLHCKELLEYGFIEPASQHCRHASNVVVAGKKDHDTGQWTSTRFCVDLRNTNRLSLKDNTLPHRPEELYQRVAKAKFKTTLDATKAFHQIPMTTEEDRDKTAFWWGNQLYRYTSMPFGAAGATAAFIRIMDYELRHLQHCTVAYVDDVCIYSDTAEQHIKDVEDVLRTLGDAGIRLHSGKSTFGSATVDFLGYRIGYNTIGAQDIKCKAIQELPKPEDKTGVRSILGLMNYYKGLVGEPMGPNYSEMARPLNDLLRKEVLDVKEAWGKEQDQALQALKDALCSGRCLKPIDYSRPIFLYTDWSNHGIGAVLGQKDENGVEHICVVISRSLSKTERQYASFQGEMLAVVWAIRTLRQYLRGIHFTLITDHSPLTTLMEKGDLQGQHLRWAISLQEFEFTVQYRPGPKNENADVPSRYPLPSTADETGARLDREGDRAREAGRAERLTRCFTDTICLEVTREPPLGLEVSPEAQVANYCENMVREQLGTSAVHRLFDVHYQEELECNKGVMFDTDHPEVARCSGRLTRVAWDALSQVRPIRGMHSGGSPAIYGDETMEGGKLKVPKKIDTRVIDKSFFREAREEGVVCYEPCGGLCAGLEMLLRCGVKVNKYLYQDISKSSQTVARARCMALSRRHPDLFRAEAAHLEQLPSNIEDTSLIDLVHAGALSGEQWVMVCGYPCQSDLSPAGKLAGLEGRHSRLFYHQAVRVLSTLQQLQPQRPPAYVLENVSPLSHRENSKIRKEVFPIINSVVGQPVSFDAARAGSYAHRLRAYWSNLFQNQQFNLVMERVDRPPDRYVRDILQRGWKPRRVVTGDRKPHYTANVVGEPMRVLPTILATQNSRAFRAPRAGTVVRKEDDDEVGETREVNLDEKAVAMGYSAGELRAAHGMKDEELAGVLGLAMDRRAMELLYAIAEVSTTKLPKSEESEEEEHDTLAAIPIAKSTKVAATSEDTAEPVRAQLAEWITSSSGYTQQVARRLSHQDWEERLQRMCSQGQKGTQGLGTADAVPRRRQWKLASMKLAGYEARHRQAFSRPGGKPAETSSAPEWAPVAKEKEMRLPKLPDTTRMVAMLASVTNQESLRERYPDIHEDELCLAWVKTGGRVEVPKEEYHRVRKRAARHRWDELMGELYMVTVSGNELLVPKPCDRIQLVREHHERTGHWGIRRTLNLLWQRHYWAGMKQDVRAVVTQCQTCQRVKTHYAREEAMLTPLEIKSFMYRWSLDLAWPTKRITKARNQRVLVMIEHYTRFVVCVPIPDKEAATIASAFRNHVLSVFGAPAECLVDGGTEFEGEFSALCKQCLIDRRVTSPSSPESNGLTERVVRTLKFCFKKMALDKGLDFEWDEMLWSLVLSYNAAKQQSTGVAPFTLLFAQEATVPPDLRARPELDFGKQEEKTLAEDLLQRAAIVKRLMVHAGCNLEIAQHRDTLRYEHRRSGSYEPKPHQFKAGDFVYIRQQPRSGMEVATKPAILKIVKVQRDGVVVLEDSTKLREKSTVQNIAPCHLQVKDQYDCSAAIPSKHLACEACMRTDGEAAMLLCDTCNRGYHTWCLNPALDGVPEGDWQCPKCLGGTVVAAAAEVGTSIVEKMAAMELQLREKLGSDVVLLPADVGPHRAVKPGREDPWQALTSRQMLRKEGSMGDLPDRVAWGNQEELSRVITEVMPGFWHEGHRTILSRKCAEQHTRARSLRKASTVQAMSPEEVQKRGDVTQLSRAQVKSASQLDWGLELVMTVPQEVRRLAHEVTWEKITQVWDPWAGTGVIGKVMSLEWPHLKVMNNDWNPQLKWHEALNALQPGNYRAWKEKYGVCDAVVTSPWFAVLDIALPLAVLASRVVACIHVPSHYMTDMTESRAQYFRKLCHAGRLHVIGHLEHGPIGRRCMWVMVFRNPLTRARMLRGGEASGVGMFTFSMGKFAMDGVTTEDAEQALV